MEPPSPTQSADSITEAMAGAMRGRAVPGRPPDRVDNIEWQIERGRILKEWADWLRWNADDNHRGGPCGVFLDFLLGTGLVQIVSACHLGGPSEEDVADAEKNLRVARESLVLAKINSGHSIREAAQSAGVDDTYARALIGAPQ